MKTAMIRKALLPMLAASAVMVSTPALAQDFGISFSFGSPGYGQPYGYGHGQPYGYGYGRGYGYDPRELDYRIRVLSQHVDRLAWSGAVHPLEARELARQLHQIRRLRYRYARNGLSAAEYRDLDRRLQRIQYRVQHAGYRW
ncbi:hypothetical protein [uncultured Brevundimonas sp.]|uniref:hypothetical protein n=1 Tax=uncultured Brevundimonas sp. TaxID=213418 RepID=UPI00263978EE|nr:hypothetical protein [uncultured Brevundimonas sp.]